MWYISGRNPTEWLESNSHLLQSMKIPPSFGRVLVEIHIFVTVKSLRVFGQFWAVINSLESPERKGDERFICLPSYTPYEHIITSEWNMKLSLQGTSVGEAPFCGSVRILSVGE